MGFLVRAIVGCDLSCSEGEAKAIATGSRVGDLAYADVGTILLQHEDSDGDIDKDTIRAGLEKRMYLNCSGEPTKSSAKASQPPWTQCGREPSDGVAAIRVAVELGCLQ